MCVCLCLCVCARACAPSFPFDIRHRNYDQQSWIFKREIYIESNAQRFTCTRGHNASGAGFEHRLSCVLFCVGLSRPLHCSYDARSIHQWNKATSASTNAAALSPQGELTFDVSTCCRHSKHFVDETSVLWLCSCSVLLLRQERIGNSYCTSSWPITTTHF